MNRKQILAKSCLTGFANFGLNGAGDFVLKVEAEEIRANIGFEANFGLNGAGDFVLKIESEEIRASNGFAANFGLNGAGDFVLKVESEEIGCHLGELAVLRAPSRHLSVRVYSEFLALPGGHAPGQRQQEVPGHDVSHSR